MYTCRRTIEATVTTPTLRAIPILRVRSAKHPLTPSDAGAAHLRTWHTGAAITGRIAPSTVHLLDTGEATSHVLCWALRS